MIYRLFFRLVLARIDPERAHGLASKALRAATALSGVRGLLRRVLGPRDERLRVRALGLEFPGPLGLAAGFDKDATSVDGLASLGFGFVEVGTVTAQAQEGNPRPRILRLPDDRAVVNSMGFPNPGAQAVAQRLRGRTGETVVGVNIGKTRVVPVEAAAADYRAAAAALAVHADYVVLNVSSPNTPGLRDMQAVDRLAALVREVREEVGSKPLLVKIGPDLADAELDAIADMALDLELDGIVAVNTTVDRGGLRSGPDALAEIEGGGISGAPLKERALEVLRRLHTRTGGRLVLVSVGGIETAEDAWERILAGATLLQGYTGFAYGGPLWPHRINRGLSRLLREAGMSSIQDAVGAGRFTNPPGRPRPPPRRGAR